VEYARREILKRGATAIGVGLIARGTTMAQSPSPAIRMAQTAVLDIAYEETGDAQGFPILLLHGFPDDARAYDEVFVDVVIHSYRHRIGNALGEPRFIETERQLAKRPRIEAPTITLYGGADGLGAPLVETLTKAQTSRNSSPVA